MKLFDCHSYAMADIRNKKFAGESDILRRYHLPLYKKGEVLGLRGIGDAIVPVIIIGVGVCLLRIVWIVTVYNAHPTMLNVCLAYPISWIVTDIAFFFYYRRVKWLYHIK